MLRRNGNFMDAPIQAKAAIIPSDIAFMREMNPSQPQLQKYHPEEWPAWAKHELQKLAEYRARCGVTVMHDLRAQTAPVTCDDAIAMLDALQQWFDNPKMSPLIRTPAGTPVIMLGEMISELRLWKATQERI